MAEPHGGPVPPRLDVVGGFDGAHEEFRESGESADPLIDGGVLGRGTPHPDLTVLVAGEYSVPGDDDGLDEAAAGPEAGELLPALPDTDVPAVGSGVQKIACGGEGVYVAFLADEGAHEAGGDGGGGGEIRRELLHPGGIWEWGGASRGVTWGDIAREGPGARQEAGGAFAGGGTRFVNGRVST